MKNLLAFMAVVILAAPVSAQDAPKVATAQVAGNWDVSFTSPQGAAATCACDASRVRTWGAYGCSHRWTAPR